MCGQDGSLPARQPLPSGECGGPSEAPLASPPPHQVGAARRGGAPFSPHTTPWFSASTGGGLVVPPVVPSGPVQAREGPRPLSRPGGGGALTAGPCPGGSGPPITLPARSLGAWPLRGRLAGLGLTLPTRTEKCLRPAPLPSPLLSLGGWSRSGGGGFSRVLRGRWIFPRWRVQPKQGEWFTPTSLWSWGRGRVGYLWSVPA